MHARVDRAARHATACNHTATHLLHAALRERLGNHVHQAGSYVGPDKLRFDFTHGAALSAEELADVENRVNEWILGAQPVRALTTTLDEARALGAMALFGEKYGDIVRMVEVGDGTFSRELCGGTHVRSTAEIGLLTISSETSSAANVRRIEAVTGPVAIGIAREHGHTLGEAARDCCVSRPTACPRRSRSCATASRSSRSRSRQGGAAAAGVDEEALVAGAVALDGAHLVATVVDGVSGQELLDLADRLKARLGDAAVVLGSGLRRQGRSRRLGRASARRARRQGGGDRAHRRAGGRRWWRRPRHGGARRRSRCRQAAARRSTPRARRSKARSPVEAGVRVLALDYGSARCGVAVSDPTGVLATPLEAVLKPGGPQGHGPDPGARAGARGRACGRRPAAEPRRRRLRADA